LQQAAQRHAGLRPPLKTALNERLIMALSVGIILAGNVGPLPLMFGGVLIGLLKRGGAWRYAKALV
jgi:chromate transporter